MKSSKDFFMELREGEEYLNCFMTKEVYNGIDFELRQLMTDPEIRQKNSSFKNDETHKKLIGNVNKAKRELRNYEYDINHKK